jgi:hypothetical protein
MKKLLLAGALLLLPSLSLAAGFAKDPIFLSKTPVTAGQSVHMYAVISNADASAFVGTLVFYDNNAKIGSDKVNLAAGATQTASILWTPSAGAHPVTAELVANDGTVAEQVSQNFTVDADPAVAAQAAASSQAAATIDSSTAIQNDIANVSPQVANASVPVFTVIDGARNSVADALDSQIQSTQNKISSTPNPGFVEGTSTGNMLTDAQLPSQSGVWHWLYTFYLWLLEGCRWLVGNAGVFYPVLAIAFLYLIYRMYRRFRRPAWQR